MPRFPARPDPSCHSALSECVCVLPPPSLPRENPQRTTTTTTTKNAIIQCTVCPFRFFKFCWFLVVVVCCCSALCVRFAFVLLLNVFFSSSSSSLLFHCRYSFCTPVASSRVAITIHPLSSFTIFPIVGVLVFVFHFYSPETRLMYAAAAAATAILCSISLHRCYHLPVRTIFRLFVSFHHFSHVTRPHPFSIQLR